MKTNNRQLVSVIITTYKGQKYIKEAIESVLRQTYNNIEIIIVDDNGKESIEQKETFEIIKAIPSSAIRYYVHNINMNGAVARNTGIKYSRGEFIVFLDNDDIFLPTHIEKCVNKLNQNKDKAAVLCDVFYLSKKHVYDIANVQEGNLKNELLISLFGLFTGSNLFLRAEAVNELSGFDEKFKRYQDIEFMIRFYEKFNSCIISEAQIIKRDNGNINVPKYRAHLEVNEIFYNKFSYLINQLSNEEKNRYFINLRRNMLIHAVLEGKYTNIDDAKKKLKEVSKLSGKDYILLLIGRMKLGKLYQFFRYYIILFVRKKDVKKAINSLQNEDKHILKFFI